MKIIDIKKIIEKSKESGELPDRTLSVIEKMINSDGAIVQAIQEGYNEMKESGVMEQINNEIDDFYEHKEQIYVEMVKCAFQIYIGRGKDEMIKYLDDNFDIYPISDREKKERGELLKLQFKAK